MDIQEIKETPIWALYEKGRNFHELTNIYEETDKNFRFYNGDQWGGAKLGDIEPVQKNFIHPIVKYKVSVVHDNLYAINYSSQNFDSPEFQTEAERYCKILNDYAAKIWEADKMDFKGRRITKRAAINSEGILYVDFDEKTKMPKNEIVKKTDIYYGNENDDDIQAQPYILIRKRMPVANAIEYALSEGMSEDKTDLIIGDNDTSSKSGDAAKQEIDDMVTIVYKLYRKDGTVHFSCATRYADICTDRNTGLTLYPVAHFCWEEKEGSARGEGEVKHLIPNQIEVNKTEARRVLTVKYQSYPQKVVDGTKIRNTAALNTVGAIIKTEGQGVDDVRKAVSVLPPAQMSPDVVKLQEDLISVSRDLAGAGDTATGQADPNSASGRAVLAVQQASRAPLTEQKEGYKNFVEDVGRIWLEYLIAYSDGGIPMEERTDDGKGGQGVHMVNIHADTLRALRASVRIDITPRSVYDKIAQEQTLENLLLRGLFGANRIAELEVWASTLDDDSVAPKRKILDAIGHAKNEQVKIAKIQAQGRQMQQKALQFIGQGPDAQARGLANAKIKQKLAAALRAKKAEAATKPEDGTNPDDN